MPSFPTPRKSNQLSWNYDFLDCRGTIPHETLVLPDGQLLTQLADLRKAGGGNPKELGEHYITLAKGVAARQAEGLLEPRDIGLWSVKEKRLYRRPDNDVEQTMSEHDFVSHEPDDDNTWEDRRVPDRSTPKDDHNVFSFFRFLNTHETRECLQPSSSQLTHYNQAPLIKLLSNIFLILSHLPQSFFAKWQNPRSLLTRSPTPPLPLRMRPSLPLRTRPNLKKLKRIKKKPRQTLLRTYANRMRNSATLLTWLSLYYLTIISCPNNTTASWKDDMTLFPTFQPHLWYGRLAVRGL